MNQLVDVGRLDVSPLVCFTTETMDVCQLRGSYCCLTWRYMGVFLFRIVRYMFWANRMPPTTLKTYSSAVFEMSPVMSLMIWYVFSCALPGILHDFTATWQWDVWWYEGSLSLVPTETCMFHGYELLATLTPRTFTNIQQILIPTFLHVGRSHYLCICIELNIKRFIHIHGVIIMMNILVLRSGFEPEIPSFFHTYWYTLSVSNKGTWNKDGHLIRKVIFKHLQSFSIISFLDALLLVLRRVRSR